MILIKKDPNRVENLLNEVSKSDYQNLIDNVNLKDLTEFIKLLNTETWVSSSYWKNKNKDINERFHIGDAEWAVYSYLTDRKLLLIEDRYYGYNASRTEKYLNKVGYYNTLEEDLYKPIINRLVSEGYLDEEIEKIIYSSFTQNVYWYKICKAYNREEKLNKLLEYE